MKSVTKMVGKTTNIFPEPKKTLGLLGTGASKRIHKDKDKDGVKDVFDCAPNDPSKQGLIHKVGKYAAKKLLYKEHAEKAKAYISRKEEEADVIKEIRQKERHKQRLETAKLREEEKGRRQREYIKAGGLWGMTRKSVGSAAKAISAPRKRMKGKSYRAMYKKKGKHYVKVRVPVKTKTPGVPIKPYKPFDLGDMPKIPI